MEEEHTKGFLCSFKGAICPAPRPPVCPERLPARCPSVRRDGIHLMIGPARGLPDTRVGAFTPTLYDEAKKKGWTVISMENDWKRIFAFASSEHAPTLDLGASPCTTTSSSAPDPRKVA